MVVTDTTSRQTSHRAGGAQRSVRQKLVDLAASTEHPAEREAALAAVAKIDARQTSLPFVEVAPKPTRVSVSVAGDARRPWVRELFDALCTYFGVKGHVDERELLFVDDDERGRKVARAHLALRAPLGKASVAYRTGFIDTVRALADGDLETRDGMRAAVRCEHLR